ncbi:hypothetical protein [Cohnella sp.]|uniref:hypothetical protein n=1 Tax=Cohnella sp. TaxID=1883426 RepID=UPI0035643009
MLLRSWEITSSSVGEGLEEGDAGVGDSVVEAGGEELPDGVFVGMIEFTGDDCAEFPLPHHPQPTISNRVKHIPTLPI